MPQNYTIENSQLGTVTIDPDKIIFFPDGIIGFEDFKKFVIVNLEEFEPFQWLLSVEDSEITFPIISPIIVKDSYNPVLTRSDAYNLGEFEDKDLLLYAIVTIRPEVKKVSANLKGPLIINQIKKLGQQVVLSDDKYSTSEDFLSLD